MSTAPGPGGPPPPRPGSPPPDGVYRITAAPYGLAHDQAGRTRRYLVSMGIRTVCFVGAFFAPSPWRWVLVAGAVLLPYVAVVVANAGREPTRDAPPPPVTPVPGAPLLPGAPPGRTTGGGAPTAG
jgi:hypothetical protein